MLQRWPRRVFWALLWMRASSDAAEPAAAPEQEQPECGLTDRGHALFQRRAYMERVDAAAASMGAANRSSSSSSSSSEGQSLANLSRSEMQLSASLAEASSIAMTMKLWLPSTTMCLVGALALGLVFVTASCFMQKNANAGCACFCSGCCGALLLIFAVLLLILKVYLMREAGPEPEGAISPPRPKMELVVDTIVPYEASAINKDGPIRTSYIEGMQKVLDKRKGTTPGAVEVLDVHAKPSKSPVVLFGIKYLHTQEANRVALVYDCAEAPVKGKKKRTKPDQFSKALADDLGAEVQKAAKRQTVALEKAAKEGRGGKGKTEVPKLLKDIAAGDVSAASKSSISVKLNVRFRCEAQHQMNSDIRAAARVFAKKHHKDVLQYLAKTAERTLPGFRLELAKQCNDPDESVPMQVCLGPESLWFDYTATKSVLVPEKEKSSQDFVCKNGCKLSLALSAEIDKAISAANKQMKSVELDRSMLSEMKCAPFLANGRKCGSKCSGD